MLTSTIRTALLATVAAAPLLSTPLFAQEAFDLGRIIVSGGLTPIEATKYGRAASVVTAKDIEARGITTVQDALRALPGVSVNGNTASLGAVRIRGGEANHTLILIDGIAASATGGGYSLNGLETSNIERIEVLRGAQSATYGASASTGVINIITRKATLGQTANVTLEVGSGTVATAFLGYRTERGGVSLALSDADDRGFDVSGKGGEKDGVRRRSATLSGDFMASEDLKLGFTLRRSKEEYDFDGNNFGAGVNASNYVFDAAGQYSTRDETTAGIFAEYSMMEGRMTHRLAFETTRYDQGYFGGAPEKTQADGVKYRLSFGLDGAVADADQLINVLVENIDRSSSSNPTYNPETTSLALEYRGSFANGLSVQAGVRHDKNNRYANTTTWNAGLSYTLAQSGIRLHASAGTGVVDPTYFQLFANTFGYTGNPNLQPERNRSFDIGATFPVFADRGSIDVTYFNENLTNKITTTPTLGFTNQAGKAKRQGLEVSGDFQASDDLALRFAYTYIDAKNSTGSIETRRPRNELTMGATYQTFGGRGSVSADLRHVSGNYDRESWGAYAVTKLPSYTTLDVAARYDLTDSVALTGRITNLFDKATSDTWGYANRGRAVYVGLNAKF